VIFDLDGVIVDSEIWWDDVRKAFAAEHGRGWTVDDRHAVMGANSRQWSETMRRRLGLDLPAEEIERAIVDRMIRRYEAEGAPVIDSAPDAIRSIAGRHPVALASSSHRRVIDAALAATGLADVFRAVVSSDEVAHGKPEPDVFLEAAGRLGVEPGRSVVVEDSLNGLKAGRAAGMRTILVPNGSVPPAPGAEEHANLVVARLADLDPATLEPRTGAGDAGDVNGRARATGGVPDTIHPVRRWLRISLSRFVAIVISRGLFRVRLTGRGRLPAGPAIYCFAHRSWIDPFVLMAALPLRPRLRFFGPKEEDMSVGGRNRLMSWTGATIPYRPGKSDLLEATRKVSAATRAGHVVAIAGEGRIRPFEGHVGPLSEGAAYFALRAKVPLVPIAIVGTSWLGFGRRVEVVVGEPLAPSEPRNREGVEALTLRCWTALSVLVRDRPELRRPGPFGRWLTGLFNDWPEGSREEAEAAERERIAALHGAAPAPAGLDAAGL
jgi:HAD superfamily hydrolase (TIGR01509 family)